MRTAPRQWSSSSRRLAALFLAVVVPSAVTLVWLGVRLLEQDQRLWADRDLERREAAADILVGALGQTLASAEAALSGGNVPDGAVLATLNAAGVTVLPSQYRILWTPAPPLREANSEKFASAEIAEFRKTGDRGLGAYTTLRRDADPRVKAGALFRLARLRLSSGDTAGAIQSYRELADLTGIAISGMPADLFARRQICRLIEEVGDKVSLEREAGSLRTDLQSGRWTLDRGGWEVSAEEVARWTGSPIETSAEQRALTEALDWLWQHVYRADRRGGSTLAESAGRRMFRHDDVSIFLQWRIEGTALTALLTPPSVMNALGPGRDAERVCVLRFPGAHRCGRRDSPGRQSGRGFPAGRETRHRDRATLEHCVEDAFHAGLRPRAGDTAAAARGRPRRARDSAGRRRVSFLADNAARARRRSPSDGIRGCGLA
jgi:hypothetical protein